MKRDYAVFKAGDKVQFSKDGNTWVEGELLGYMGADSMVYNYIRRSRDQDRLVDTIEDYFREKSNAGKSIEVNLEEWKLIRDELMP